MAKPDILLRPDLLPRPMLYEQIGAKDFTLVQVFWHQPYRHEQLVVGNPFLAQARARATAAIPILFPDMGTPAEVHYYPRTYIDEARKLFERGLHD